MTDVTPCKTCGIAAPFCENCKPEAEIVAAALWRAENPDASVFDCDLATKNSYRRRVVDGGDR